MASFTPNKGLAQPTVCADVGQWGTELNSSMATLDNNLGGVAAVSLAGASGTVVATTGNAQCLIQNFTGAVAGNVIYQVPALGGMYICENNTTGAFTLTVETTASGSIGTIIPQGTTVAVFSDGTNVSAQTTPNPGTFSNLTVSGTLGVAGAVTFSALATSSTAFISTGTDAGGNGFQFRATSGGYGVGLRNDGSNAYLLQTASGSPNGSFNSFTPYSWNLSTGVVTIDGTGRGANAGGAFHATGAISTAAGITASLSIAATGALSGGSVTSGSSVVATTNVQGANVVTTTGYFETTGSSWQAIGGASGGNMNDHLNANVNWSWDNVGNFSARTALSAPTVSGTTLTASGGVSGNTVSATTSASLAGVTCSLGNLTSTGSLGIIPGGAGGFGGKNGTGGSPDGHYFNLNWTGSQTLLWIDASNTGVISVSSDRRVKKDIIPAPIDFLKTVQALEVVEFSWRDIAVWKDDGTRVMGFISQDVQKIIPSAVFGEPDAVTEKGDPAAQSIMPLPLIAANTGAIQQLIARVEALEAALKDRHSMYQEGLPEWPAKTVFSWRERLMAKLRRLLKRWRGTPDA